ncbi:MAG: T9SS type A sorting domain-containing protein [Bacteroidales bacterium]|nr:T9SS type A sorting domain-containing protein [Bacteroidales bacterium]
MKVKGFFLRALLAMAIILPLASRAQQVVSFNDYAASRSSQSLISLRDQVGVDPNVHAYGTYPATVTADPAFTMDLGDSNDLSAPVFKAYLNGSLTVGSKVIKPLYNTTFTAADANAILALTTDTVTIVEWLVAKGTDTLNFQVHLNKYGSIEFRYGLMDQLTGSTTVQVGIEEMLSGKRRYLKSWGSLSPLTDNVVNNITLAAGANNNPHPAWNLTFGYSFNRYCYHTMQDSVCSGSVTPNYQWNFDYFATDALNGYYYREGTAPSGLGTPDANFKGPIFNVDDLFNHSGVSHDTMLSYLIVDSTYANQLSYLKGRYTEHCEHIGVLELHIGQSTVHTETAEQCDSYTWHIADPYFTDTTILLAAGSGSYARVHPNSNIENCDNVYRLNLTLHDSSVVNLSAMTRCNTGTNAAVFTFPNRNNTADSTYTFTTVGTYPVVIHTKNQFGCDSNIHFTLTVNAATASTAAAVDVCDSYTWSVANYGGTTGIWNQPLTTSGTYTHTVVNQAGCDSVITLPLTVRYSTASSYTHAACGEYDWTVYDFDGISNPQTFSQHIDTTAVAHSQNYTGTFVVVNAENCDSTISYNITLNSLVKKDYCVKALGMYHWAVTDSTYEYPASANVLDTIVRGTTAAGCDSLHILNMTLHDMHRDTVCGGYYQGVYYTRDTTLLETENFTVAGCDSVANSAVVIISRQYHVARVWANQPIDWPEAPYNNTYSTATNVMNPPFHNRPSEVNGCDSTWFLYYVPETGNAMHLCAEQFDPVTNTYNYRGFNIPITAATHNLPVPTTYTDTLKFRTDPSTLVHDTVQYTINGATTMANVDSMYVIILDLFIHDYATTHGTDADAVCELFDPDDVAASTHTYIYGDASQYYGADTITFTTLDHATLTINEEVHFTSITGCDSIVDLTLTVNPTYNLVAPYHQHCEAAAWDSWSAEALTQIPELANFANFTIPAGTIVGTEFNYGPISVNEGVGGCPSNITIQFDEMLTGTSAKDTVHYCVTPTLPMNFYNGDNSVAFTVNTVADFTTVLGGPALPELNNPGDTNQTASTNYTITVQNTNGCDSVITLTMIGHGPIVDTAELITNSDAHYLFRGVMYNVPNWAEWIDTTLYFDADTNATFATNNVTYQCPVTNMQRLLVGRRNINSWNVDTCAQFNWTIRGYFAPDTATLKDSTRTFVYRDRTGHLNENPWYWEILPNGDSVPVTVNPEIHHLQANKIFDSVDRLELTLAEGTSTFHTVVVDADSLYYATGNYIYALTSASENDPNVNAVKNIDFTTARTGRHDAEADSLFHHFYPARWCDSVTNIHVVYDYQSDTTDIDTVIYMSEIEHPGTPTHWYFTFEGKNFYFDTVMTNATHTGSFDTTFLYDMEHFAGLTVADSFVNLHINVVYNYDTLDIDTICAEQHLYTLQHTDETGVYGFDGATLAQDMQTATTGIQIITMHLNMDMDTTYTVDYTVRYADNSTRGWHPVKYHGDIFQLRRIYGTDYEIACDNYEWINGVTYTESTTIPTHNLAGSSYRYGCDSVVTLNLTVVRSSYDTTSFDCADITYAAPGVYTFTWTAHPILHDNYNPATGNYESTITPSTLFVFKEPTQDTIIYLNEYHYGALSGCDSIITAKLTLTVPTHVDTLVYVCEDTYTWPRNSKTYTWNVVTRKFENGTNIYNDSSYVDTLYTFAGCNPDTVYRLQLIKSRTTFGIDFAEPHCDSYTWTLNDFDGNEITVGTFTQSYHAPYSPSYALHNNPLTGCDSVVYLDLTINDSVSTLATQIICEAALPYTYNYNGTSYDFDTAGTYRLVTAHHTTGCDSIQYYTLNVHKVVEHEPMFNGGVDVDTMICLGTDMTYRSVTLYYGDTTKANHYFVDGLYTIYDTTYVDIYGTPADPTDDCIDTIYQIHVRVLPTTYKMMPEVVSCRPTYEWYVNETQTRLAARYGHPALAPRGTFLASTFTTDSVATTIIVNYLGCDSVISQPFRTDTINVVNYDTMELCENQLPYTYVNHGFTHQIVSDTTINDTVLMSALECDSLFRQVFVIRYNTASTDVQVACDTYTWMDGNTYTASINTPTFTVPNQYGCDSVITLNLTVNYSDHMVDVQTACDNFIWNENMHIYNANNTTDFVTYANQYGCDSIITLNLTVNYSNTGVDNQTACDTYTWIDGNTYTSSIYGPSFNLVGANQFGCDSIVTLNLVVNYSTWSYDNQTVCDSLVWMDGITYYASTTTPVFHTTNVAGCDSAIHLNLTVNYTKVTTDNQVACDSYLWSANGATYTTTGVYGPVTLPTSAGCDSIVTLNLTVNYSDHNVYPVTACDLYTWPENGQMYNASNTTDFVTYTNQYGCDSVITLNLTMNYRSYGVDNQVACDYYMWMDGNLYTSSINGPVHILPGANQYGCDSVVTLNLVVNYKSYGTDVQTACDSYTWINGVTYTATNFTATHTLTGANAVGCDSIVTLNLTVHYSAATTDVITACDSYTWTNGVTYWANNNTAQDTFYTVFGCDSIVTLNLTVNYSSVGTDVQTACDSYTWMNGVTYTASNNSAVYHILNSVGCDSTIYLNLTVNYSAASTETHVACDSYIWPLNGQAYLSSTNTPSVTLTTVDGCDSVVTLNLTVNYSTASTQNVIVCDNYTWVDGINHTTSGVYNYTITNAAGCDSNMTLFLTVRGPSYGVETVTACDSYTWYGTAYTASTNTPQHTLVAANQYGCDSIVTLHLTVNYSTAGTENVTACDSYTWHGTTYHASAVATHHFTNVAGCDSLATLNLTIYNSTQSTVTATACDSYTWHGTTYTASTNNATYHTTNAHGCDSTVTLNLTVNHSTASTVLATACDSYTWHGVNYTASTNNATYTTTNAAGCDSVVTLHLTINHSSTGTQTVTSCDNFTWMNGITYTASTNTPTYTLVNAQGCDSVVTLHLTILNSTTGTDVQTACDSYTWINGVTYSTNINNGSVTYTTTASNGCDSVITLVLTIHNSVVNDVYTTACDSYTWSANGTTYTTSGDYTVALNTVHGCDSVVTLHLTINHSNTGAETAQAVTSFDWHGTTYTASGTYTWTGTNVDGCDSVVTLTLTIIPNTKPMPEIVAYNGKVLMLNHYPDGKDAGDYVEYDSYQWYKDGVAIDGATLDFYNESNYANLEGCYYVMVPIDNIMVASNTLCFSNQGIEDVDALEVSFTVAPNPVASGNMMKVETSLDEAELQGATLVMFDVRGRKVMEMPMETSTIMVNVNQATGAYMLRLTTKSGLTAVKKVIVK